MKILIYRWDIYPYEDIITTLKKQGHSVDVPVFGEINHLRDDGFEKKLANYLSIGKYDVVFSVNYFSTIARVCHNYHIYYISWTVDTPLISMQTDTVYYPENRIFTFDRKEWIEFQQKGVEHIYHLPLAGNPDRLFRFSDIASQQVSYTSDITSTQEYLYPVSFVGSLYHKNRYEEMCQVMPDYLCGYLDAAIEAQLHVSCGNLLSEMMSDSIFQEIKPYLTLEPGYEDYFSGREAQDNLLKLQFNTRVLCHKVASISRTQILNKLATRYPMHLFTTSDTSALSLVYTHPPVDYRTEMSAVFCASKINLNITSPNINTGIPLRVWDILSVGGFVLSDYRPEYDGLLQNGHDIVLFDGLEDLSQKVDYYLNHEEERRQIAQNGYERVLQGNNYSSRMETILHSIKP